MKKALKVIGIMISILLILCIIGYFYISYNTQCVIGFVQCLAKNVTNTINTYEPLGETISDYKSNGQYIITNINYTTEYPNSFLDIQYPDDNFESGRPTLIYLHGGGYMYGSKSSGDPLAANESNALIDDICSEGFNIVNIDYAFVPDYLFPEPLKQVNIAFEYLIEHCEEYHLNMDNVVIMGSSAGAIMTSQFGSVITNQEYANTLGITSALTKKQVAALVIDDAPLDYSSFDFATKIIVGNYLNGTIYPSENELLQYNNITWLNFEYIPSVLIAGSYYHDMRKMNDVLNECNVENLLIDPLKEIGKQQMHCYLSLERTDEIAKDTFDRLITFIKAKT